MLSKKDSGIGFRNRRNLLRGTVRDDAPPAFSPFRSEVENVVCVSDDVQIVLNDHDSVAQVCQPVEHLEQLTNVIEVKSGGRLIK